jgi:hypothetical protein
MYPTTTVQHGSPATRTPLQVIRITRRPRRARTAAEIDVRTPSGRLLPY